MAKCFKVEANFCKLSNILPGSLSASSKSLAYSLNNCLAMRLSLTSFTVTILLASAYASSGDRSQEFIDCVDLCKVTRCGPNFWSNSALALRVTRWSCTDDCKYECMHDITDRDIQNGRKIHQYHGKWPFWRLAGMQEPASVAFSLLNLWAHARGASKIRRKVPESHPMRSYYLLWSAININAWIWSSVFHTRGDWYFLCISQNTHQNKRFSYYREIRLFLSCLDNFIRPVLYYYPSIPRLSFSSSQSTDPCIESNNNVEAQSSGLCLPFHFFGACLLLDSPPPL